MRRHWHDLFSYSAVYRLCSLSPDTCNMAAKTFIYAYDDADMYTMANPFWEYFGNCLREVDIRIHHIDAVSFLRQKNDSLICLAACHTRECALHAVEIKALGERVYSCSQCKHLGPAEGWWVVGLWQQCVKASATNGGR